MRRGSGGTEEWRGSGLVLVAEDEDPVRRFATLLLNELGFVVVTAANGADALDIFRERHGELAMVLLDLTMPGLTGEEFLAAIARDAPGARTPIMVCTGSDSDGVSQRFPGQIAGVLKKPYRLEEFRTTLRGALESARGRP
jgi:CheY-like chemotaxis protein